MIVYNYTTQRYEYENEAVDEGPVTFTSEEEVLARRYAKFMKLKNHMRDHASTREMKSGVDKQLEDCERVYRRFSPSKQRKFFEMANKL